MKKINAILTTLLASALLTNAQEADVKVTAKIDSVETRQGLIRRVDIEVLQPEELPLNWGENITGYEKNNPTELYPSIEIRDISKIDTARLGNGRLQLKRQLLVQPWDSGEYVIPGIELTLDADTFRSNPLALRVIPAEPIDSINTSLAGLVPIMTQEAEFWDFLPDWIYYNWWALLIAVLAIIAAIILYIRYHRKKNPKPAAVKINIIPPYDKAMGRLQVLQQQHLCEKGEEKRYYTELTDILREYLEGRFGILAMEMTTSQIKRAVYATVPEKTASSIMGEILEMSDYVKFAKMRPLPDDNVRAFTQAQQFIESTRPQSEQGKESKQ